MSETLQPTGYAAAAKVLLDGVKTTFGAIIVVIVFFGIALVSLIWGGGENLPPETRANIIYLLITLMVLLPIGLIVLRIVNPSGLTGPPPQPETREVTIRNTSSSP